MTKHEFLKQLRAELERLPGAERKRQLDYYAELLDDMIEDGMEPEMAVERLGPVSEIVHTIFQDIIGQALYLYPGQWNRY